MLKLLTFLAVMAPISGAAMATATSHGSPLHFDDVEPVTSSPHVQPAPRSASSQARSQPAARHEFLRPGTSCTWEGVAARWGVNPHILYAIAKTESNFNPRAINRANNNGSEDVGMMQINSFWFPILARKGISREDLFDACVSLDIGAWVLSQNMERHGNTWKAIGAYNAVTPSKQQVYADKVFRNLPSEALSAR